ncbi:MAG: shikimate kinase [Holosporales bacterium]
MELGASGKSFAVSKTSKTIVLVGMMGVGKSSVGWRLAKRLGVPFFDSDREVERAAGCSIPDIYALWGEQAFKEAEQKTIKRLLDGPVHVLSTGDGSFIYEDLRQRMLESAICVWLMADLETIYRRVSHRKTRPQLLEGDSKEILKSLMEERTPIYAEAQLSISSQEEAHDLTVERVLKSLVTYCASGQSSVGQGQPPSLE